MQREERRGNAGGVRDRESLARCGGRVDERKEIRGMLRFLTYVTKRIMVLFFKARNTRERVGLGGDIIDLA